MRIRCRRLYLHHLGEDEDGGSVLRFGPKVLTFLRTVDAPQPELLSPALVEDGDSVAVDDTDDLATPCRAGRAGHNNRESARATRKFLI